MVLFEGITALCLLMLVIGAAFVGVPIGRWLERRKQGE